MARFGRLRASSRTREIVTWTIGVVVVAGVWLLVSALGHHFGWSWP